MSKAYTRENFLKTHWRRYPSVPARCYNSDEWRFGRLENMDSGQLRLKNQAPLDVSPRVDQEIFDAQMGPAIPPSALKSGDVVVLKYIHQQVEAIYLLSPNIDESAQPSSGIVGAVSTGKEWQIFLEAVRSFFTQRQFTHWKTPYFVPSSGVDAHIDFYRASGVRTKNSFYLPTSPELELKKAIVKGEERVFEIKSCFRDDDRTAHHRPEFTMLEWYRSYEDKWTLLDDIQALLPHVAECLGRDPVFPKIQRRSLSALFQQYVGLDISPRTARQELSSALTKHGLDQSSTDDWDDLFFRLYIDLIEPQLGLDGPEVIYNFPATQGSLARINAEGWADRFELYWNGVELANAYQEQNDPFLIEVRARGEVQKRQRLGREPNAVDEEFIKMMKLGFPPCAGIAMGLDRLFMVLKGHRHV